MARGCIQKLLIIIGLALLFAGMFSLAGIFVAWAGYGVNFFRIDISSAIADPVLMRSLKVVQVFQHIGFFIASSLVFALVIGASPVRYLGVDRKPLLFTLIASAVLVVTLQPVINWMVMWNESMRLPEALSGVERWMREKEDSLQVLTEAFVRSAGAWDFTVNMLVIAAIPALGEEMLFRGVVQRLFAEWTRNIHWGILIAGVLFSALHFQFYGFFPRFALGVLFGYLYAWSGSLWVPVCGHFVNNGAAVCMAYLYEGQENRLPFDPDTFGAGGREWPFLLAGVLLTAFLIYGIYRREKLFQRR